MSRPAILFTGYAPVHFLCFKPLFDALANTGEAELYVSGGLRSRFEDGTVSYDTQAMYRPFGLPGAGVLTVEEIADLDADLLICANTNRIEPRSCGQRVQIFHGLSFRNRAVREHTRGCDAYFVLGPYMRRRLKQTGLFERDDRSLVSVGFPKTDRLLNGTLDRLSILDALGLSGERPVVLYAPTGAAGNSLEGFGEQVLNRLQETGDYDVLVKLHDHPKGYVGTPAWCESLEHERVRLVRDADVIPALYVTDLLISDASSVANEYALLDRPIVFLDVPDLIAAAAAEDARLDLETWGRKTGPVVSDAAEAIEAVRQGLAEPERYSHIRSGMVADLFYNPGRATETALEWIGGALASTRRRTGRAVA